MEGCLSYCIGILRPTQKAEGTIAKWARGAALCRMTPRPSISSVRISHVFMRQQYLHLILPDLR